MLPLHTCLSESVGRYAWGVELPKALKPHSFDMVLASDVLYSSQQAAQLLLAVDNLAAPGATIWLSHVMRYSVVIGACSEHPNEPDSSTTASGVVGYDSRDGTKRRVVVESEDLVLDNFLDLCVDSGRHVVLLSEGQEDGEDVKVFAIQ